MKRVLYNVLVIVALVMIAPGASAQMLDAQAAAQRIYRNQASTQIDSLLDTIDVQLATESPRLNRVDGHLKFFGAPPGAPAQLDATLRTAPAAG